MVAGRDEHDRGVWISRLIKLSPDALERLQSAGCKRVYVKVLDDGTKDVFWSSNVHSQLTEMFARHQIQVWAWGRIFNQTNQLRKDDVLGAIYRSIDAGCRGFVLSLDEEVKLPDTHNQLRWLLQRAKNIIPSGKFGYSSFGHPGFNRDMPWKMLHDFCDLQFPQMYFEKWRFGHTKEAEVESSLKAHEALGLFKPILPVFSSDPATPQFQSASAAELQTFLDRYPGSSIWRAPHAEEKGHAYNLLYDPKCPSPTTGTRFASTGKM